MTTEDELRVKLMIAEARIIALEREAALLRKRNSSNGTPKIKDRTTPLQVRFAGKTLTPKQRQIYLLLDGTCFYCGGKITEEECTVDHVVPLSRGGRRGIKNCVPSCSPCNNKKGSRMPTQAETEFAAYVHNRYRKK